MRTNSTRFSQDVFDKICERIADGESLRKICGEEDMPCAFSFLRWVDGDATLSEQYVRAREMQSEFYANEIVEIADTAKDAQLARLQIDARKWTASKLLSKRYGDKVQHTGDGGGPVQIERVTFAGSDTE